jgi:uncharacterized DUF497 family protein
MIFEFDEAKSQSNKVKHGIDFRKAQELWLDDQLVVIPANHDQEERWLVIGRIDTKHWSAIVTHRGKAIRIISVRRSRDQEVEFYERN